jgi:hypothetical protein
MKASLFVLLSFVVCAPVSAGTLVAIVSERNAAEITQAAQTFHARNPATREALERLKRQAANRIAAIVSVQDFVLGGSSDRAAATQLLEQLDVPVFKAIRLCDVTRAAGVARGLAWPGRGRGDGAGGPGLQGSEDGQADPGGAVSFSDVRGIETTCPQFMLSVHRSLIGVPVSRQRRSRNGPPWLTTAMRCVSGSSRSCTATRTTRPASSSSDSPPGGLRVHGSAVHSSLTARGMALQRWPSHSPKSSSWSSGRTRISQPSRPAKASARA